MDTGTVTEQEIRRGLRDLGIRQDEALFAHSSLSSFGRVSGGAETVCRALLSAVGRSGTIAMPTFTWSANHARETVTFDVGNDPSETGLITETFRLLPGARRSDHPCHSIAAIGPLAGDLMGDGATPFGRGSSMYRLYELDFRYLFLGCSFTACTALHVAEELCRVPYRYYRSFTGSTIIRPDGTSVPSHAREFLSYKPFRNSFEKMEEILQSRSLISYTTIGAARIMLTTARSVVDTAVEYLKKDPGFLLTEPSQTLLREWLQSE